MFPQGPDATGVELFCAPWRLSVCGCMCTHNRELLQPPPPTPTPSSQIDAVEPVAVLGGIDKSVSEGALASAKEAAGGKLDKAKKKVWCCGGGWGVVKSCGMRAAVGCGCGLWLWLWPEALARSTCLNERAPVFGKCRGVEGGGFPGTEVDA